MAVGLKTLLEAAQYLEEQEQQLKSPISSIVNSNHLNGGNHLNNDTNASCFIAHYSLAVGGNRNTAAAAAASVNGTAVTSTPMQTGVTTILNDENHKTTTSSIEGFFANGHGGGENAAVDNFATRKNTCQNIMKNTGNKKQQLQQQNIATSAPASSTGFQQVAFGNGFSLTTKTKSPTELFISSSGGGSASDRKDVNETNNNMNNNNCSIHVSNGNKGQLATGVIIQQHMNNHHHSTLPTNSSNILNSSTNNNNNISSNINNNHHKLLTNNKTSINTINNNINNDDFDTNSLSPPGPQRVRSASTSSNVYVFGSLDHAKSAANHANRLQSNGKIYVLYYTYKNFNYKTKLKKKA